VLLSIASHTREYRLWRSVLARSTLVEGCTHITHRETRIEVLLENRPVLPAVFYLLNLQPPPSPLFMEKIKQRHLEAQGVALAKAQLPTLVLGQRCSK
jgi:hypothetical protein